MTATGQIDFRVRRRNAEYHGKTHPEAQGKKHGPFFEVKTKGTSIEYTNNRDEAYSAYWTADAPKEVIRIDVAGGRGFRRVVERQSGITHRAR